MSADDTAAPASDQTQTSNSVPTSETGNLHPLDDSTKAGLMERMGIPNAVRERLKENQEQTESEQSDPEEADGNNGEVTHDEPTDESDAPTEEESDETETEEPVEEEEKPDEHATALQKKNYKLRQQKREFRERAEKAEAELAKLKSEPEPEPTQGQASIADPLAHITDQAGLDRERKEFRILRDQARSNPDGWVVNEGKDGEYVVTREQAAQWLGYAEDVLSDYFPRKEVEINQVRPASTNAAKEILPTMLQRGTEDHHAAQLVWQNYPMLANHPERDYLTAIFLRGFKLTATEMSQKAKGNGDSKFRVPEKIMKAHAEKNSRPPLQRQTPPGRSSVAVPSKAQGMDKAMERMKQSGGDRESLIAGLTALEQNERPRPRDPVPI